MSIVYIKDFTPSTKCSNCSLADWMGLDTLYCRLRPQLHIDASKRHEDCPLVELNCPCMEGGDCNGYVKGNL